MQVKKILRPYAEIPLAEKWLLDNKDALESISRGFKQSSRGETVDLGSFSKYIQFKQMIYKLLFTKEAVADLNELENNPAKHKQLKAARKALGYLEVNPKHPV